VPGRLLAITPPASLAPTLDAGLVDAWIRGGAEALGLAVLLREPGADLAAILADRRLAELRAALAERGIPALVSVDAAALDRGAAEQVLGASPALAGVQLRGDPSPALLERWRASLPARVLGRSCHGSTPVAAPAADYNCLAPVFAPRTAQPGVSKEAIGLDALRRWAAEVPRVFALGGVDPDNAEACLAAGATGIAGISLFFGQSSAAQHNVAALSRVFARFEAGSRHDDHAPQARQRR
jgi:thiamine monophosphate synthase